MTDETQDRRQHPRADDTLKKIEDLTYSVLRKSIATEHGEIPHEPALVRATISPAVFLLIPVVAIPIIAILYAKACRQP